MVSSVSGSKNVSIDAKNSRKITETNDKPACGPERVNTADGSKAKPGDTTKIIINSVHNASDSNISDEVETKELDKSFTFSNLVSGISEIYSVDINKGLKSKDSSGEADSSLRAKSSNLKFP